MSLIAYSGIPGSGKTLNSTITALKHYKKSNSFLKYNLLKIKSMYSVKAREKLEYYSLFKYNKINNIYSTYPILLDKKRQIYSHFISLWDLNNEYSFLPDSLIVVDESQLFCDSDEYNDKKVVERLRNIGKFMQAHRHFGINQIIITSQDPDRIFKKARNICSSYLKFKKVKNFPFGISFVKGIGYYTLDSYGRYIPSSREQRKKLDFDYYKFRRFFIRNKVYNSYDSRYLAKYNHNKELINKVKNCRVSNLQLEYKYLVDIFEADKIDIINKNNNTRNRIK